MPHFLIKEEDKKENFIELLDDENFFHLVKVLRVKQGEKVKFIDKYKTVFLSEVTAVSKNKLTAKIIKQYKSERFLKNNIILVQSVLMNDAQNLLIANAVQTGIKEIYPVISDNTSPPLSSLKKKKKKWAKISNENFKQCERADMVKINPILNLKEALLKFKKENILIFAEKYETHTLNNCLKNIDLESEIAVVIGPEGGFSEEEFNCFKKNNYKLITLGNMIYKAPNAVVAAISNIVSRIEND